MDAYAESGIELGWASSGEGEGLEITEDQMWALRDVIWNKVRSFDSEKMQGARRYKLHFAIVPVPG